MKLYWAHWVHIAYRTCLRLSCMMRGSFGVDSPKSCIWSWIVILVLIIRIVIVVMIEIIVRIGSHLTSACKQGIPALFLLQKDNV